MSDPEAEAFEFLGASFSGREEERASALHLIESVAKALARVDGGPEVAAVEHGFYRVLIPIEIHGRAPTAFVGYLNRHGIVVSTDICGSGYRIVPSLRFDGTTWLSADKRPAGAALAKAILDGLDLSRQHLGWPLRPIDRGLIGPPSSNAAKDTPG